MASRNQDKYHFGLDAEIQQKLDAKFDKNDAATALNWIASLAGTSVPANTDFHESLKSGVLLCKAANAISPGACPRINTMSAPFMQRENVVAYIDFCKKYGVPATFVTQDLFEGDNLVAVIDNIFSLGGLAQTKGFRGPALGVKHSAPNASSRKFEVPASGSSVVSRQTQGSYGYADTRPDTKLSYSIVKSNDAGAVMPSKQNSGSLPNNHTTSGATYHSSIVKSGAASSSVASKQTSGSLPVNHTTSGATYHSSIVKSGAASSSVASKQTSGSLPVNNSTTNASYHSSIVKVNSPPANNNMNVSNVKANARNFANLSNQPTPNGSTAGKKLW
jgi:hypothetical protein